MGHVVRAEESVGQHIQGFNFPSLPGDFSRKAFLTWGNPATFPFSGLAENEWTADK